MTSFKRIVSRIAAASTVILAKIALLASAQNETETLPQIEVKPQAPPEASSIASRLLGFAMFIAWVVFIGSMIYTGIKFMQGDKEAPSRLRNVIIGGILVALSTTIVYWIARGG